MPSLDLSDEEWTELRKAMRDVVRADKYPLSPRIQALKRVLASEVSMTLANRSHRRRRHAR